MISNLFIQHVSLLATKTPSEYLPHPHAQFEKMALQDFWFLVRHTDLVYLSKRSYKKLSKRYLGLTGILQEFWSFGS